MRLKTFSCFFSFLHLFLRFHTFNAKLPMFMKVQYPLESKRGCEFFRRLPWAQFCFANIYDILIHQNQLLSNIVKLSSSKILPQLE